MRLVDLIPAPYRLLANGVLLAALAWQVQDWHCGQQLELQARRQAEQDKRLALEQRLSASEQTHYRLLSDPQRDQGRLRDRLATADLRLSLLLDTTAVAVGDSVSAPTTTSGVVHGATRAQLDPAHAQRIIGITDAGDRGLIALTACQSYIKSVVDEKLL